MTDANGHHPDAKLKKNTTLLGLLAILMTVQGPPRLTNINPAESAVVTVNLLRL